MKKKWWMSKTLWANAIAAIALFLQSQFGYQLDPVMQGYILAGLNFVLRFVTKDPVV
jgi:hypothetical protein